MAEKKKILYIVEAMGGGVFTYIVDIIIHDKGNFSFSCHYLLACFNQKYKQNKKCRSAKQSNSLHQNH